MEMIHWPYQNVFHFVARAHLLTHTLWNVAAYASKVLRLMDLIIQVIEYAYKVVLTHTLQTTILIYAKYNVIRFYILIWIRQVNCA